MLNQQRPHGSNQVGKRKRCLDTNISEPGKQVTIGLLRSIILSVRNRSSKPRSHDPAKLSVHDCIESASLKISFQNWRSQVYCGSRSRVFIFYRSVVQGSRAALSRPHLSLRYRDLAVTHKEATCFVARPFISLDLAQEKCCWKKPLSDYLNLQQHSRIRI